MNVNLNLNLNLNDCKSESGITNSVIREILINVILNDKQLIMV